MKRAMLNFWVDVAVAVAFVVSAVSGVVFLLPLTWRSVSASGVGEVLWVSMTTWRTMHDWAAVVMIAGVAIHCALHYRWIVNMARRTFGLSAMRAGVGRAPAAPASRRPAANPSQHPSAVASQAVGERHFSRGAFLTGLAGVAGAVVLAGMVVGGSRSGSGLQESDGVQTGDPAATGDGGSQAGSGDGWGGGEGEGSSQGDAGNTATIDVAVDAGACNGCGRCLEVCPTSVFAWSGGRAAVRDAGSCIDCRRCLHVCPTGAIAVTT